MLRIPHRNLFNLLVDALLPRRGAFDVELGQPIPNSLPCREHHLDQHPEIVRGLAQEQSILLCVPRSTRIPELEVLRGEIFKRDPRARVQVLVDSHVASHRDRFPSGAVVVDLADPPEAPDLGRGAPQSGNLWGALLRFPFRPPSQN